MSEHWSGNIMLGLINRSLQCFLHETYGANIWADVAVIAGCEHVEFEAMLTYPDEITENLIQGAATILRRPRETILEDLGTYLVSNPSVEAVRRLLRFGGATFVDLLHSMEDLQARGRLAVPDLELPEIELQELTSDSFVLSCVYPILGTGHVLVGLLRAMADDYGALVLLEHAGHEDSHDRLSVQLLDQSYAEGRHFELALSTG
jgi:hypothetical protein